MRRSAVLVWSVLGLLVVAEPASVFAAGDMSVVRAPTRVKAGASTKVIAAISGVTSCKLSSGKVSATAPTTGADRVTFSFTVSPTARPGRYSLTLRCGTHTKRLKATVRARTGQRGSSRRLIKGRIRFSVRAAPGGSPAPALSPAPAPPTTPAAAATPVPTATPEPVVPGPGNSYRAVYALAADQVEDPGHPAAMVAQINAVNGWFATQTVGAVMPRWMRDAGGAPVVTVVRLAHPAADYAAGGHGMVVSDLQAAAPPAAPTQKTVVWMDVSSNSGCGVTGSGVSWIAEAACNIHPAAPATWPFDGTYLTAHELTHNFGAVPDCAPHSDGTAHVNDDPRDVLYSGPNPRDWDHQMLDPGHDDYYGTGSPCGDIATSPFWTATSDPLS